MPRRQMQLRDRDSCRVGIAIVPKFGWLLRGRALAVWPVLPYFNSAFGAFFQGALLGSSSSILDQAVDDGYWDSTISGPALQLLDGVIGAYSSDSMVSSEEIGEDAASK